MLATLIGESPLFDRVEAIRAAESAILVTVFGKAPLGPDSEKMLRIALSSALYSYR